MKNYFLAIALLFLAQYATARHLSKQDSLNEQKLRSQIMLILKKQSERYRNKTNTVIKERCIANTTHQYWVSQNAPPDSTTYKYSNCRGSSYDYNYGYQYSGYYVYGDYVLYRNYKNNVLADTISDYTFDSSWANPSLSWNSTYKYDAQNNLIGRTNNYTCCDSSILSNGFDAYNNVILDSIYQLSIDLKYITTYSYNNQHQLILDSMSYLDTATNNWWPLYKDSLSYDNAGNLLSLTSFYWDTVWHYGNQYRYTYYNNNQLKIGAVYYFDGTYLPEIRDSFGYSGTSFYTYDLHTLWSTYWGAWTDTLYIDYCHVNNLLLPDTTYSLLIDYGDLASGKTAIIYDSYGNPTISVGVFSRGLSFDVDSAYLTLVQQYYYEEYIDSCSMATSTNIVTNNDELNVWPVPATSNIYMEVNNASLIKQATIINTEGQVMRRLQNISANTPLDIGDLPPGVYYIKVSDNEKNLFRVRKFIKL
jgi:hypothetical protein